MSELAIYPEHATAALDPRHLLARCDRLAVELRRALAHRHDDDGYWAQLGTTAALAQRRRALVRRLADVLHVIRAAARDRVHGGRRFPDLAAQAAWLAGYERWRFAATRAAIALPETVTLAALMLEAQGAVRRAEPVPSP